MRKVIVLSCLLVPRLLVAQNEGVGIIFDNSGSMKYHFSADMRTDAQNAALDLVVSGTFNKNSWTMEAQSDDYTKSQNTPVWKQGSIIYLHAFGELNSRIEPFFKTGPTYSEVKTGAEARSFVSAQLYNKLNFTDQFTNFDLAKYLCWWNISTQLGAGGKNYFMNILIISDFLRDNQREFAGAGDRLQNSFIASNAGETTLFRLVHRNTSRKDPNVKLEIRLVRIGPHFIMPPPSLPDSSDDRITLRLPRPNYKLSKKTNPTTRFTWAVQGTFDKYILEIHSAKPRRKILTRIIRDKSSVAIPTELIVSRMERVESNRLMWFVKGVYPENSDGKISITSNRSTMLKESGGPSKIWILLLLLAIIAAVIFIYPRIRQLVNKTIAERKKEKKPIGHTGVPDEEEW